MEVVEDHRGVFSANKETMICLDQLLLALARSHLRHTTKQPASSGIRSLSELTPCVKILQIMTSKSKFEVLMHHSKL